MLPLQKGNIQRYEMPLLAASAQGTSTQTVWLKKAGAPNPKWRYRLLAGLARLLRLKLLRPVPSPGGEAAIAQEAERLNALKSLGLRTPAILAVQADGLLLADLGAMAGGERASKPSLSLADLLERSRGGDVQMVLSLWQKGLASLTLAHAKGAYLSQAFARNLIWCADGVVAYIDFEDDPGQVLDVAQCQARDWLCFLHSTALTLEAANALSQAAPLWQAALKTASPEVQHTMQQAASRLAWMRHLPRHKRWGRDVRRLGAAAALMNTPR
jgi:hypothetical protein